VKKLEDVNVGRFTMCVQSVCYTNVIGLLHKCEWVLILCLIIQCLIISENKVHGVGNAHPTLQPNRHPEAPANPASPNAAPSNARIADAPKSHNTENVNATTEMPQRSGSISSSTIQESVQPVRKSISTGAFIRAFYVFVGLGAIIVMYIVVRTVRLRRKKTAVRKYGVLASREDVELTPLGIEDEDEDMALFDMTAVKSRP